MGNVTPNKGREGELFVESLQKYPAGTMHDSVNTVADDVYSEIFGIA